jgi:hypothetical protein
MALSDSVCRSYSRGKVKNVVYNDRCGYAIVFYDPIYDLDTKIPPLKVADLPYTIPLERQRLQKLKPAGKPVCGKEVKRPEVPGECEAAKDFIQRKILERKMDEIRDTCYNIHKCYEKAEKFDMERRKVISPRVRAKIRGRSSDIICDVLVDDAMQNVDYVFERNLEAEETKKKKLALVARRIAARAPKKLEKLHIEEPKLKAVKEEPQVEESTQTETITKQVLEKALKKAELKFDEFPVEKEFLRPSPPRYGFKSERVLRRNHEEVMSQRLADALLFEITYGRQLRRLKNEIKRLKEEYS